MKHTYLEIIEAKDDLVVKRFNLTGKSEVWIGKIEDGINRNLNHEDYYTTVFGSDEKLPNIE